MDNKMADKILNKLLIFKISLGSHQADVNDEYFKEQS